MSKHFLRYSVLVACGLVGCATSPVGSSTQDTGSASAVNEVKREQIDEHAALRARVAKRWDLLLAGNLDEAYSYLSPGKRSLVSQSQYKGEIKMGIWRSAKVDEVVCSAADLCKVKVFVSYEFKVKGREPLENTRPLMELWSYQSGEWWYIESQ